MFIVIDGPDGVGKTTQVALLVEHLANSGQNVMPVQDPGHTRLGQMLRGVLKDASLDMREVTQALLFAAARAETAAVVAAHLDAGGVAVADRWTLSTYAYQGRMQGVPQDLLKHIADVANCGLVPDLTILLDMESEEALRRKAGVGCSLGSCAPPNEPAFDEDRFDGLGVNFHAQLRAAYLELASAMPNTVVMHADGYSKYVLHEEIRSLCTARIPALASRP